MHTAEKTIKCHKLRTLWRIKALNSRGIKTPKGHQMLNLSNAWGYLEWRWRCLTYSKNVDLDGPLFFSPQKSAFLGILRFFIRKEVFNFGLQNLFYKRSPLKVNSSTYSRQDNKWLKLKEDYQNKISKSIFFQLP